MIFTDGKYGTSYSLTDGIKCQWLRDLHTFIYQISLLSFQCNCTTSKFIIVKGKFGAIHDSALWRRSV
jgi:hypothetical protein